MTETTISASLVNILSKTSGRDKSYTIFYQISSTNNVGWLRCQTLNKIGYYSDLSWLLECIFGLIYLKLKYQQTIKSKQITFKDKKRIKLQIKLQVIKNTLDIGLLIGFLRPGGAIGNKTIGILGTLSSLIGIYQQWK